ncbi:aquaporin-like protein [Cladochytrium replicatum]|nr:aquaporin-like protein [Cladochytrium replicatum]
MSTSATASDAAAAAEAAIRGAINPVISSRPSTPPSVPLSHTTASSPPLSPTAPSSGQPLSTLHQDMPPPDYNEAVRSGTSNTSAAPSAPPLSAFQSPPARPPAAFSSTSPTVGRDQPILASDFPSPPAFTYPIPSSTQQRSVDGAMSRMSSNSSDHRSAPPSGVFPPRSQPLSHPPVHMTSSLGSSQPSTVSFLAESTTIPNRIPSEDDIPGSRRSAAPNSHLPNSHAQALPQQNSLPQRHSITINSLPNAPASQSARSIPNRGFRGFANGILRETASSLTSLSNAIGGRTVASEPDATVLRRMPSAGNRGAILPTHSGDGPSERPLRSIVFQDALNGRSTNNVSRNITSADFRRSTAVEPLLRDQDSEIASTIGDSHGRLDVGSSAPRNGTIDPIPTRAQLQLQDVNMSRQFSHSTVRLGGSQYKRNELRKGYSTTRLSTIRIGHAPTSWRHRLRPLLAEMCGTFLLVLFGTGTIASLVLSDALFGLWELGAAWGFGTALAIYSTASISGAHLNPAISFAMALFKNHTAFTWVQFITYSISQLIGAMLAATLNYELNYQFLESFESRMAITRGSPQSMRSAMIFNCYFPNPQVQGVDGKFTDEDLARVAQLVSPLLAFLAEALGAAVLVFVVFCINDHNNTAVPRGSEPFFIGFTVSVLIAVLGPTTQACINPARDFGPRLVATAAGWGSVALPGPNNGFWVYLAGPMVGAILGGGLFFLVIKKVSMPHSLLLDDCLSFGCSTGR